MNVPTWPKMQASIDPRTYMRNGVRPGGPPVSGVPVGLLNHCLGHRMRVHFAKSVPSVDLVENGGGAGAVATWRWLMRTLPNETTMRVRYVLGPQDSTTPEPGPSVYLQIVEHGGSVVYDDGTSGTDKTIYYGPGIADETLAVLDDVTVQSVDYSLTADTEYECTLYVDASASVMSLTAYGLPRSSLDPAVDVCVDPARFLVNQPITVEQNADLLDSLETLWKRHGAAAAYSVPGITGKSVGITYTNILDATGTWASTTAGLYFPSLNTHSLETTLGTPTYYAPVKVWTYAVCTGGTGTVRLRWGTGASDYTQVTGITTEGWYLADGSIPGNADQKLDIQAVRTAGTMSVYAAGLYHYLA